MKLRFIDPAGGGGIRGALNMGIDEALVAGLAKGLADGPADGSSPPTLRFYRWTPSCITIGYFQDMEAEVDLDACRAAGVDCLRRVTAGGAVFHDAELTYSVVLPLGSALAPLDVLESYSRICGGIVAGLARLGVEARFAPINDIEVGGKKLSGNAQTRKRGCLLQHGTILLGLDVEKMFGLLRVPPEKLKRKLIEAAADRVTCLGSLLGREVGFAEAAAALGLGFAEAWAKYGVEFEPGRLSDVELEAAAGLASQKYGIDAWNLRR